MYVQCFYSLLALSPEDVLPAVYLCTNKIAADHENVVGLSPVFIFWKF
jgi:DNA ligase-1